MSPESEKKRREERTPHGKGGRSQARSHQDNYHLLGWFTEGGLLKLLTRSTNLEDVRDPQSIL